MKSLRVGLLALIAALTPLTQAMASSVNLASPSGNVGMSSDGTNLLPVGALCGATSTTLETACVNQVAVNAAGQLGVIADSEGSTGTSLPSSASFLGYSLSGILTGATGNSDGGMNVHVVNTISVVNPTVATNGATAPGSSAQIGFTSNSNLSPAASTLPFLANGLTTTVKYPKTSAGILTSAYCYNPNSSVTYLQVFNAASGVSLGSTVPVQSYGVPATNASGITIPIVGIQFSAGIAIAATTTATGSTAPSTAMDCTVTYN